MKKKKAALILAFSMMFSLLPGAQAAEIKNPEITPEIVYEPVVTDMPKMLTAEINDGKIYPEFSSDYHSYTMIIPGTAEMTYTVSEGADVEYVVTESSWGVEPKVEVTPQTPDESGVYTLALEEKSNPENPYAEITQEIVITKDSNSSIYALMPFAKKEGFPDDVVDFISVNSQYTNRPLGGWDPTGIEPWITLSGKEYKAASLGSFGGYITYYYEDAIQDDPNNKYGVDFYAYGNGGSSTSYFEPAQAWVSEDGETWYALAGSAHYDDGVNWDYSVTYTKAEDGTAAWTDSDGNSNDNPDYAGDYPIEESYPLYNFGEGDSITLSGLMLPSNTGKSAVVGEQVESYPVQWGYADVFSRDFTDYTSSVGHDINPYTENSDCRTPKHGFDLKWAVDKDGNPVEVNNIHYIKLQTASNIWHELYKEKSSEIECVKRTVPQEESVGKTTAPESITISDGIENKKVLLSEDKQVYDVNLGNMKYVTVSVDGTADEDNVYINNSRSTSDHFTVTNEGRLVRVLVQNGDSEPFIALLRLKSSAENTDEIIEGIKINAGGTIKTAKRTDAENYSVSVGYRIDSAAIMPVVAPETTVKINDEDVQDSYELKSGINTFTITAEKDGETQNAVLTINKETSQGGGEGGSNNIIVSFKLMGDTPHGDNGEVHTLKNGKLKTWISNKSYTLTAPATVLDVFEAAVKGKFEYVNADGNYISKIGDLEEFDNGPNSGWMYTLNGKKLNVGISEQELKSGDRIVFFYTDDYTLEDGTAGGTSSGAHGGASGGSASSSFTVTLDKQDTTTEKISVERNGKLKKPADPKRKGYVFGGWYTDKDCKNEYDFSKSVTKSFTLYAKWTKRTNPFTDVKEDDWFYDAISFVSENGVFKGVSEDKFAPNEAMSRAMFVTILYRTESEPKSGKCIFTDVADNAYYKNAVAWANENGIIKGVSQTEFAPEQNVSREQLAVIMARYAEFKNMDLGEKTDLSRFADGGSVSDWAKDETALAAGLMYTDKDMLRPKADATRAEAAYALKMFTEK